MALRTQASPTRSVGRPREFDMDAALDAALIVYRERGYNGTSISHLREAMGLTAGSLYKAFKDKRAIFIAALDRYLLLRNASLARWLASADTGREKVIATLNAYAEASLDLEGKQGCLVVGGVTDINTFDPELADHFRQSVFRVERLFADFLQMGMEDGSLPSDLEVNATARYLLCIVEGLRVLGKLEPSKAETDAVLAKALQALG